MDMNKGVQCNLITTLRYVSESMAPQKHVIDIHSSNIANKAIDVYQKLPVHMQK